MKKYSYEVTKCYLVQIRDEEGNEITSEYVFDNKKDVERYAKKLRDDVEAEEARTEERLERMYRAGMYGTSIVQIAYM